MTNRLPPRRFDPVSGQVNGRSDSHPIESGAGLLRVFGDSRLAVEADLLAVFLDEQSAWSVEEYGVVRQWSLTTGRQVQRRYLGEVEPVWAFSSDGKYLAAAGQQLTVFDLVTGRDLARTQPAHWVTALAWSADGRWLATGLEDGSISIWAVPALRLYRSFRQGHQSISALAYSSDGECLAAADEGRQLVIWRRFDGTQLAYFLVRSGRISALAWHPQAALLCSAGWDTHAHLWSPQHSEPLALFNAHAECVTAIAFSRDGQLLATADNAGMLRLWWFDRRTLLHEIAAACGEISCLAIDPTGRRILTASEDRRLMIWDTATGKPILGCGMGAGTSVRLAVTTSQLALVTGRQVQLFDWRSGCQINRLEHPHGATAATFDSSSQFLLTADALGSIHVWRVADGNWQSAWQEHRTAVRELSWDEDGKRLASAGGSDGYVYLWAWPQEQPIMLLPEAAGGASVETVAFVPGANSVLVGGVNWLAETRGEGGLLWWDCSTWQHRWLMRRGVTRLAVRRDGQCAVVANLAGTAWLVELPSGKILAELAGHSEPVLALAFHPRTGEVLTASEDHLLAVWSPDGHWLCATDLEVAVHDAQFSRDGAFVFTANSDQTAYQLESPRLGFGKKP